MKVHPNPCSGKPLRGGKGLVARTCKPKIYVRDKQALLLAKLKYGNKVKYELFPLLEDIK